MGQERWAGQVLKEVPEVGYRAEPLTETLRQKYGELPTEEELAMAAAFRDFTEKEIMPVRALLDVDEKRELVGKIMDGLVKLGLQKAYLPTEVGGMGMDYERNAMLYCLAAEEIGRGDPGIVTELFISGGWAWIPAVYAKNKAVMEKLMAPFTRDEVHTACMALTEPHGGCNIEAEQAEGRGIRTIARLEGNEWVINGSKSWPSSAIISEVYCTVCTTDPNAGKDGFTLIYVPADTPGLSFGKAENKMGMIYTDVNADIFYDNVRVPKEYRAGASGEEDFLNWHRVSSVGCLFSAALALGPADGCLEIAIDYTGNRYYAGKRVREHSLQANMLADMIIAIQSARAYWLNVAAMGRKPEVYGDWTSARMEALTRATRCIATDAALMVANRTMELMGSYGYVKETHVEKYLRDVKIIQLWLGGAQLSRIHTVRQYYDLPPYEKIEPLA